MTEQEYAILEREFQTIRDERGLHQNTAVRIGNAFLDLLRMTRNGNFDEITFNKVLNKPTFLQGLITLGSIIFGEYAQGLQGGIITEEGVAELKELWVREHAEIGDGSLHYDAAGKVLPALEVRGDSTFNGNLSSPEFVSAFFGGLGWAIQKKEVVNSAGVIEYKYHLEIDDVTIRNTLRVFEMIISQLMGENANRYFSDMLEVDHYDHETGRIWLKTSNGRLYNPFRVGDLIEVQQYNDDPSEANDWYVTKHYELRITAAGLGDRSLGEDRLDWVEFDNFTTTMENGTPATLIQEHDTLVRADNDRNSKRKGLVSVMAIGENTPYIDVLYGQKTDPQHALKSRMGNLEGIHTDLFGWLEGFGLYVNNLYGVGKFFNYQTGESLSASIRMTRELFKSVYSETVYNINEEDNFLSNGFFQHDLEDWTKCATDGSAAPADSGTEMLGTVEEAGGDSAPILVNGTPISVSNKVTAQTEDKDGIRVLHLYGMGVAQDFSKIKANGTHKEMVSSAASSTETKNVADKLYMGVRILPVTAGKLRVYFKKASGGYSGWERDIISDINWQLYQSTDNSDQPWDYTGSGKLIVSYTGECYIRFVALTTNAVANSKEDYSTLFEQNSRHITLRANKISSDLTEAVADFTIKYDSITQTVTDNKSAADRAFQTLTTDLNAETSARQSLENQWHATWVYQNDNLISLMAGQFNSDGTIKGYADLKVQVSGISTTVTNNKSAADTAFGNINSSLSSLWSYAESIDDEQGASATWISQNKNKWQAVAASFNSDGTVKASGNVELYVNDKMSAFTANADWINFIFTKAVNWYWGSVADENKRMGLDSSGSLWISGEFRGGNITNNVTIGNSESFRMRIEPSGDNGARLVGLLPDGSRSLYLGYGSASVTTHGSTISTTSSMLQLTSTVGSLTHIGSYRASMFQINGSSQASILCHAQTEPTINLSNTYDSNGFMIKLDSSGKIKIGGNVSLWNVGQQNGKGYLYVDGNGYVKVQTS